MATRGRRQREASLLADDVQFCDDQSGATLRKKDLTGSVKKNVCGRVTRELVPGTFQVFPRKGYGAVQIAVHRVSQAGHENTAPVGQGRFIHLWQYKTAR